MSKRTTTLRYEIEPTSTSALVVLAGRLIAIGRFSGRKFSSLKQRDFCGWSIVWGRIAPAAKLAKAPETRLP